MTALAGEVASVVASADRVREWAKTARAGDQFAYATRMFLPLGAPGAAEARRLAEAGFVHLKQRRVRDGGGFTYIAERSSRAWTDAARRPATAPRPLRDERGESSGVAEMILPVLSRAARFGRPCPTDRQLAERARVASDAVAPALAVLRREGLIRVHAAKAPTLRQVVIVETGHKTGMIGS